MTLLIEISHSACSILMPNSLYLARALCVARDDLDSVRMDRVCIIEFEVDIFDYKRPHLITEAVGIEVSLNQTRNQHPTLP